MKLSNKSYDTLKWAVQIALPAFLTLIGTVGATLSWPYTEITLTILGAVITFLGTVVGISNHNYNKGE